MDDRLAIGMIFLMGLGFTLILWYITRKQNFHVRLRQDEYCQLFLISEKKKENEKSTQLSVLWL